MSLSNQVPFGRLEEQITEPTPDHRANRVEGSPLRRCAISALPRSVRFSALFLQLPKGHPVQSPFASSGQTSGSPSPRFRAPSAFPNFSFQSFSFQRAAHPSNPSPENPARDGRAHKSKHFRASRAHPLHRSKSHQSLWRGQRHHRLRRTSRSLRP